MPNLQKCNKKHKYPAPKAAKWREAEAEATCKDTETETETETLAETQRQRQRNFLESGLPYACYTVNPSSASVTCPT